MILPFSTQLNGKPTMFTNKIVKGIWKNYGEKMTEHAKSVNLPAFYVFEDLTIFQQEKLASKIHSMREDKNDRWKPGRLIHFFINCRQKNMFQFAPVLPVISTQRVEILWGCDTTITAGTMKLQGTYRQYIILVDGRQLSIREVEALAVNDGFDNKQDFLDYFNTDFKGKIIHWTDYKY